MSHNPRQKKRNAQFRKKHFDAKGRAQGEKSKVEQKQASAAPAQQKIARQPQPEEAAAEGKQEEAQQTQEPSKYGRRKVASNWERYADSKCMLLCLLVLWSAVLVGSMYHVPSTTWGARCAGVTMHTVQLYHMQCSCTIYGKGIPSVLSLSVSMSS